MHELTLAQEIIEITKAELEKAGGKRLRELELEIGLLAGVEYDALQFALDTLAAGSVIEGVRILINKPEGTYRCMKCGGTGQTTSFMPACDSCSSYECTILTGKELRVKSILIE